MLNELEEYKEYFPSNTHPEHNASFRLQSKELLRDFSGLERALTIIARYTWFNTSAPEQEDIDQKKKRTRNRLKEWLEEIPSCETQEASSGKPTGLPTHLHNLLNDRVSKITIEKQLNKKVGFLQIREIYSLISRACSDNNEVSNLVSDLKRSSRLLNQIQSQFNSKRSDLAEKLGTTIEAIEEKGKAIEAAIEEKKAKNEASLSEIDLVRFFKKSENDPEKLTVFSYLLKSLKKLAKASKDCNFEEFQKTYESFTNPDKAISIEGMESSVCLEDLLPSAESIFSRIQSMKTLFSGFQENTIKSQLERIVQPDDNDISWLSISDNERADIIKNALTYRDNLLNKKNIAKSLSLSKKLKERIISETNNLFVITDPLDTAVITQDSQVIPKDIIIKLQEVVSNSSDPESTKLVESAEKDIVNLLMQSVYDGLLHQKVLNLFSDFEKICEMQDLSERESRVIEKFNEHKSKDSFKTIIESSLIPKSQKEPLIKKLLKVSYEDSNKANDSNDQQEEQKAVNLCLDFCKKNYLLNWFRANVLPVQSVIIALNNPHNKAVEFSKREFVIDAEDAIYNDYKSITFDGIIGAAFNLGALKERYLQFAPLNPANEKEEVRAEERFDSLSNQITINKKALTKEKLDMVLKLTSVYLLNDWRKKHDAFVPVNITDIANWLKIKRENLNIDKYIISVSNDQNKPLFELFSFPQQAFLRVHEEWIRHFSLIDAEEYKKNKENYTGQNTVIFKDLGAGKPLEIVK